MSVITFGSRMVGLACDEDAKEFCVYHRRVEVIAGFAWEIVPAALDKQAFLLSLPVE